MKIRITLAAISLMVGLTACQKEISSELIDPNNPSNPNNQGNIDGELLVKALEITPATGDTNVITVEYDASKRMVKYLSKGKVNGVNTNIIYTFNRATDGKVQSIKLVSDFGTSFDSTLFYPYYQTGSNRLAYIKSTSSVGGFDITDSSVITYNAAGRVIRKESFQEALGIALPGSRIDFTYDANGNITVIANSSDAGGGIYVEGSRFTYTYNGHKAAVQGGDEFFIIMAVTTVSPNDITRVDLETAAGDGTTILSNQTYNSFDRPSKANASVTGPGGSYNLRFEYYYQ
ncbi:MAG: hypothetical protein SFU20_01955 [Chitinophagaceae bacterium]|nr:hypothetical protein [Chitinophagaceae bacterium]